MSNPLEQYTELLRIRRRAYFRNLIIAAIMLFLSGAGALAWVALYYPGFWSVVIPFLLTLTFSLAYLNAGIENAIIQHTLELIEVMQREARDHP